MRQHPIWVDVSVPNYRTGKSFGGPEITERILIGSSRVHSSELGVIRIASEYTEEPDWTRFFISIDGEVVKERWFNIQTKEFSDINPQEDDFKQR